MKREEGPATKHATTKSDATKQGDRPPAMPTIATAKADDMMKLPSKSVINVVSTMKQARKPTTPPPINSSTNKKTEEVRTRSLCWGERLSTTTAIGEDKIDEVQRLEKEAQFPIVGKSIAKCANWIGLPPEVRLFVCV